MIVTISKQLPRKMIQVARRFDGDEGVTELRSNVERWLRETALVRGKPIGHPWWEKGWCSQKVEVIENE